MDWLTWELKIEDVIFGGVLFFYLKFASVVGAYYFARFATVEKRSDFPKSSLFERIYFYAVAILAVGVIGFFASYETTPTASSPSWSCSCLC